LKQYFLFVLKKKEDGKSFNPLLLKKRRKKSFIYIFAEVGGKETTAICEKKTDSNQSLKKSF